MRLTVLLRNDAPMIFAGDSPSYRTVTIELTEEQAQKITLKYCGKSPNGDIHEEISRCILER